MEPFARALVRWRWAVLVVWAVIGAVAAVRAPATPGLLNIRGGSERETEASRTEQLLNERFARPIGEFFAVTLEGPSRFDAGPSRVVLDSVLAALGRQPYVRGLVSYPATGDTTFLSRDRRATFVLVAIDIEDGDSAGAYVPPTRETVRRSIARAPNAGAVPGAGDRPGAARPRRARPSSPRTASGARRRCCRSRCSSWCSPSARWWRPRCRWWSACWRSRCRSRSSASSPASRRCPSSCST